MKMAFTSFLKRDVPILLIILFAIPMLLNRYIVNDSLKAIVAELGFWSSIIGMIAWGLGVIYLFQGEYAATKMKPTLTQKVSFGVLIGFSLLLVGMAVTQPGDLNNAQYLWVYYAFYRAQTTAFYGLLFLYLGSASFRMLRARSLESTVLLLAGVIYIMRNASIFTHFAPWLGDIGEWVYNYPNKAATTGATICMAFGSLLIAARQLLGRERTAIEVA